MYVGDSELQPGESLLWSGGPKRRRFFAAEDVLVLIAMVVWLVGVFVITQLNSSGPAQLFFLAAVLVACYFMFGLPLLRYLKLGRTTYLVTDRRVVIRTSFLGGKERSEYLTALSPPVVRPAADGTGTITFGELGLFAVLQAGHGMPSSRVSRAPALLLVGIEDPARVRDLIVLRRTTT